MKKQTGITLIALTITIIVILILAGVTIQTLTGDNGLITKAGNTKEENLKASIREKIQVESTGLEPERQLKNKTDREIFETIQDRLDLEDVQYEISSKSMTITTKEGYIFTVLYDGTVKDGKFVCLDITDGNIDFYSNGYKQYKGNLQNLNKNNTTEYGGEYIITGNTTENVVRVCDEGRYDITIKDLNIDVQSKNGYCAFTGNGGNKATGCIVNITLEGNNFLQGGSSAPGLGFVNATPNINGVSNGSTLTIQGNGDLEARGTGFAAGIGSGYTGGNASVGIVSNVIINSGNITAVGGDKHGAGIGGTCYKSVNNIIINGGNINSQGMGWIAGIGVGDKDATADNIIINGGNINSNGISAGYLGTTGKIEINGGNINVSASYGCGAIGSYNTSKSGVIEITGGNIYSTSTIGEKMQNVIIEGGTINISSTKESGISCAEGGNIRITGGNILTRGKNYNIGIYSNSTQISYIPKNSTNYVYETQIKLEEMERNKKITRITIENTNYGINDIYTLENGMLYLYLPLGTRTINIEVEGNTYSGTIETEETSEMVTLNKIN